MPEWKELNGCLDISMSFQKKAKQSCERRIFHMEMTCLFRLERTSLLSTTVRTCRVTVSSPAVLSTQMLTMLKSEESYLIANPFRSDLSVLQESLQLTDS